MSNAIVSLSLSTSLIAPMCVRACMSRPELIEHVGKINHLGNAIVQKWQRSSFHAEMEKLAWFFNDIKIEAKQEPVDHRRVEKIIKIQALWRGKASCQLSPKHNCASYAVLSVESSSLQRWV